MKSTLLIIFVFIICNCVSGQYYSALEVNSNGKVFFQKNKIKKPKHLKSIIAEKNDAKLNQLFKKYRKKQQIHNLTSRIRDFGLFYGVINEEFKPTINPIPLALGLSGTAASLITRKYRNKYLNELVDYYNYLNSSELPALR